jgi:hypothetical protein
MSERSGTRRKGWRRTGAVLATMAVIAAGCTSGGESSGPTGTVDLEGLELVAALARYGSCEAFLADVKAEALERVGPYGLGGGPYWGWAMPDARMEAFAAAGDDAGGGDGGPSSAPVTTMPPVGLAGSDDGEGGFSGTNVQERGVDEPDLVKTDGELLAVVAQQSLQLIDVTDPAAPRLRSTTPLAGWNSELLLHGDRLIVLQQAGDGWGGPVPADAIGAPVVTTIAGDEMPGGAAGRVAGPGWYGGQLSTLTQLDVSDPADPRVERTWTIDGAYVSARLVDGAARVVLRSDVASRLPFVYPSGPQAEEAATIANRAVIEASTVEDWVPTLTVTDSGGGTVDETTVAPCDQLYRPTVFAGFGMVSVLTADLGGRGLGTGDGVGLLSSGEIVYASPTSLYVATNQWVDPAVAAQSTMPRPSGDHRTDVHQFSTEGSGPARYLASGSVDGYLLNQFSMSEHDGHLRVAVTEGQWDPGSASSVVVLARRGERLDEVGRVGDLGKGEQIYAVRFMGDMGYVVTFRQIDPLYTIDLSVPSDPRVLGELKIPGYSAYLHPIGEGLLLGVGQNATDEGRILGSQVSLFDVSNPDPQRVALLELGEGTNSEVEYDHRAFLVWRGLAVLPYVSYQWDSPDGGMDTGAIGVTVDAEGRTLSERGRITHLDQPAGDQGGQSPQSSQWWDRRYGSQIRRSVVIGDTLLTLSERGLLASDLASLAPQGWLSLGG